MSTATWGETIADMLAAATETRSCGLATPPWLERVAERLHCDPTARISLIASDEGVHPVYLARMFRRHFGRSPRSWRLAAKASSAIGGVLAHGRNGADAAQAAGFADESHMLRSVRDCTGLPLSAYRALLA